MMYPAKSHRISCLLLAAALLLCLVSGIGARAVMTDGGSVEVKDVRIETDFGLLSMLIYKPKAATAEHPAPAVVTSHGILNSREMQDLNQVELSRRGVVVVSIDMYSHGHSSAANSVRYITNDAGQYLSVVNGEGAFVDDPTQATSYAASGMIEAVEYVWNELGYVDHTRIGVTGHSMGAINSNTTLQYYCYQGKYGDGVNKLSAGLLCAGIPSMVPADYDQVHVGVIAGQYDEFVSSLSGMVAPMLGMEVDTPTPALVMGWASAFMAIQTGEAAQAVGGYQPGTLLRNPDGLVRAFYTPAQTHPRLHFSNEAARDTVEFFDAAWGIGGSSGIANDSLQWGVKEFFNCVGLVGFFLFLVPFVSLLLETPFFSGLRLRGKRREDGTEEAAAAPAQERPVGRGQYALYFGVMLLLTILPGLTYFKFMELGSTLLKPSALFPMNVPNEVSIWAMLNGVLALVVVFAVFFAYGRRRGVTAEQLGLTFGGKRGGKLLRLILKTVLLAALAVFACYLLVYACDYLFKTDFRIYTFGVKTFDADKLPIVLCYLTFFLVWSFANNVAVNGNFRKGMPEWLPMVLSILSNVLGVVAVVLLYYCPYFISGRPLFAQDLRPILLYPFIPLLAIAAVFARLLYQKTGSVYLGTVVNAALLCIITVANTQTHFIG